MSVIDIVLAAIILFGLIRGLFKGLFVEVASLLALVLGIYGAIHFSNYAADFLKAHVDWSQNTLNITAFAITFVIIVLAVSLAGKALTQLANFAALGLLNKLLGAAFGAIKMALIASILLHVFHRINNQLTLMDKERIDKSALYHPVKNLAPQLFPDLLGSDEND